MPIKLTKFNGRKDNKADQVYEMSWEHFAAYLKKRRVSPFKWGDTKENENAPLFSPVEYHTSLEGYAKGKDFNKKDREGREYLAYTEWTKDGHTLRAKHGKILRSNVNVKAVYMIVFDYDSKPEKEGKPAVIVRPEDIMPSVDGLNYAIYSTHNSTSDQPRFRLVLPLEKPLSRENFEAGWPFGFDTRGMDEGCKDLARMFLMPSVDPALEAQAFSHCELNGKYFVPPKIVPVSKKEKREKKAKKNRMRRGNYETLNALEWFTVHGCNPVETEPQKYHVDCPWAPQHTGGKQGETDTVLWTDTGPGKWPTFNCSHDSCQSMGRDIQAVMKLWGDADEFCAQELQPGDIQKTDIRIKALGHDENGKYYYQNYLTHHIVALKASEHRELNGLYRVCDDLRFWLSEFGNPDEGKVDWKKAARDLMHQCHRRGYFRPNTMRGAGVWRDDGRYVVNLGRGLMVNGEPKTIFDFESEYVYDAMVKEVKLPEPATPAEMQRTFELITRLSLKESGQNVLLAGQVVCGYLSGILKWRPHLWLTGEKGTGKSSILNRVLAPLWKPMGGIYAQGSTTAPGLRQNEIRMNAVPVIVDESESNDRREIDRIAQIVSLARSASSEGEAGVFKGTTTGTGHSYNVRCCFVLTSIVENLEHDQDKDRFTVIQAAESTKQSAQRWDALEAELVKTFTKDFALRLYSKSIEMADTVTANIEVFHHTLMQNLPHVQSRWCDQMGALLGAAWTLYSGGTLVTASQAWTFFSALQGLKEMSNRSSEHTSMPKKALATLLAHIPREQSRPLGEMVEVCINGTWENRETASQALTRYGLRVKDGFLYISSNHPQLEKIFRDAGITSHYNLLSRMEGATKGETLRFGLHRSKSVKIPLPKTDEEGANNGTEYAGRSVAGRSGDDEGEYTF